MKLLTDSKVPVEMISTDIGFEPYDILAPAGWTIYKQGGHISWFHFSVPPLEPGESLSGFGFHSAGPPKLGNLFVRGEEKVLQESRYYDGPPGNIVSYSADHQRVECFAFIPSPRPERIKADDWIGIILKGIQELFG